MKRNPGHMEDISAINNLRNNVGDNYVIVNYKR